MCNSNCLMILIFKMRIMLVLFDYTVSPCILAYALEHFHTDYVLFYCSNVVSVILKICFNSLGNPLQFWDIFNCLNMTN